MGDRLKDMLRAKAEEMRVGPDLPSDLRLRARRKRLANAAVAAALVGAVGFGSFTGFRFALEQTGGSHPVIPAGPRTEGIPSIFPLPQRVPELQSDADTGDAAEWLDPQYVAMRFAMDVMGWERDEFRLRASSSTPGRIVIWNPMVTVFGTDHIETILHLQRYQGREDGIILVTEARSPAIEIDSPQPWDPVRPGQTVHVQGRLGSHHEDRALLTEISTVPGGTHSVKNIGYGPEFTEFSFAMDAARDRAVAISFTSYDRERTNIATTAFRLHGLDPEPEEPQAGPTPGPTPTSDDATPAPVPVEVADGTGDLHATSYLGAILQDRGRGTRHGGYSIVADWEVIRVTDRTVIYCLPRATDEAERLRRLFFAGADIREGLPQSGSPAQIRIHLGRDFLAAEEEGLAVFDVVYDFLDSRLGGTGAERFLSPEARQLYEKRRGGLSLYDYSKIKAGITGLRRDEDGSWRAVVILDGTRYETLELTRVSADLTQWSITYAERNS